MKAWIVIVLAACGSKGPAVVPPPVAPPPTAAPAPVHEPTADEACRKLRLDHGNAVLGDLPRAAMAFAATATDGKRVDLAQLRGHVVVMAFESSLIGPARVEQQRLEGLATTVGDDLAIVRVTSETTVEDARLDVPKSAHYANVFDHTSGKCSVIGPLTHGWGVDILPETFLIDRAGNVRFHVPGAVDWSSEGATACIHALAVDAMPAITTPPDNAAPPEPPCVDQAADPKHVISGTITFADKKNLVKGTAIFITAKSMTGGSVLAVDKVTYDGHDLAFELDDSKSMIEGVVLSGNVVVTALYDLDGDVLTREPGDRKGQAKVRVPAKGVTIVIDSPR
jgi:peroxiredoxin/predicted small lipoprotein YifL